MPSDPKELLEYKTDHDLLIELRVEMRGVRDDIKSLRTGTQGELDDLKSAVSGLQEDTASLKTTRAIAYAYAGLVTVVLIPIVAAYITAGRL